MSAVNIGKYTQIATRAGPGGQSKGQWALLHGDGLSAPAPGEHRPPTLKGVSMTEKVQFAPKSQCVRESPSCTRPGVRCGHRIMQWPLFLILAHFLLN